MGAHKDEAHRLPQRARKPLAAEAAKRVILGGRYDIRQISDDLLSELNTLGGIRGYHAHNSHAQPGQVFDPFDQRTKVEGVLDLLLPFDNTFEEFRASQFDPDFAPTLEKKGWAHRIKRFLSFSEIR